MLANFPLLGILSWLAATNAHLAAFHKGMYCINGSQPGIVNLNSNEMVTPLYQLPLDQWWFHHYNGCDEFPPAPGDFLDLPAGGSFTVEIAGNRGQTTLSFDGQFTSAWPDGNNHPDDYNVPTCIITPNMHAQNQSRAAGTAFAISYESDIKKVTPENLVVFTVRYNTPWKRITTYDVPADMPPCPEGGCTCAWGWVPNGCGQPNMYHQPFKCQVLNSKSTTPVAPGKPPVWCEGAPSDCTVGAKQMIYWNQASGNNIQVDGFDMAGDHKSPAYNSKCGFKDGAQNDIFVGSTSAASVNSAASTSDSSMDKQCIERSTSRSVDSRSLSPPNHNGPLLYKKKRLVDNGDEDAILGASDTVPVEGISSHKRAMRAFGRAVKRSW